MKFKILDFLNQDPGLKILFPESDYYVFKTEDFSLKNRLDLYKRYGNLKYNTDIENIKNNSDEYILFVIAPLYNTCKMWNNKSNGMYNTEIHNYFNITIDIICNNNFKKIYFFDNFDYDYDPNQIFIEHNIYNIIQNKHISFFKRFYAKNKIYEKNVFSFPYIMFGYTTMIDILNNKKLINNTEKPIERLFFAGALVKHDDDVYNVHINRREILQNISKITGDFLVYKNNLSPDNYIEEINNSKFCLDLLGVGEPNKRTFEILASGRLLIQNSSRLKWNFDEKFCEETYYNDHNDLYNKLKKLLTDETLYKQCLNKQNYIVNKYMTINSIRDYIKYIITIDSGL